MTEPARTEERAGMLEATRLAADARLRQVEEKMPPRGRAMLSRFRERIRSQPLLDATWRVAVFALGMTLVVAGLIMFVIPGPGFATVILGLVVLASEFAWASRALDPVKNAAARASQAALDPKRRRRTLAAGAVAGVAVGIAVFLYLERFGLAIDPVWQFIAAVRSWIAGLFTR